MRKSAVIAREPGDRCIINDDAVEACRLVADHTGRYNRHERTADRTFAMGSSQGVALSPLPSGRVHDDELFRQIREATAQEYKILGELGLDAEGRAYLARDLSSRDLVVLQVRRDADALEVLPALTDAVPISGGVCPACRSSLQSWSEPCPGCGQRLAEASIADTPEAIWERVVTAAADSYHVRGSLDRVGGAGRIYFAHERETNRLVGLVIQPADAETDCDEVLNEVWTQAAVTSAAVAPSSRAGGAVEMVPRKRSGLPVAAIGLLILVPVAVAVVWLNNRGAAEVVSGETDTVAAVTAAAQPPAPTAEPPAPAEQPAAPPDAPVQSDRGSIASSPESPPDSVVGQTGTVTIVGELPTGWFRVVNRARPSNVRKIVLSPNKEYTILVGAKGYCPWTTKVTLKPGQNLPVGPQLDGEPMIGGC